MELEIPEYYVSTMTALKVVETQYISSTGLEDMIVSFSVLSTETL
jgi:hypothetical protein